MANIAPGGAGFLRSCQKLKESFRQLLIAGMKVLPGAHEVVAAKALLVILRADKGTYSPPSEAAYGVAICMTHRKQPSGQKFQNDSACSSRRTQGMTNMTWCPFLHKLETWKACRLSWLYWLPKMLHESASDRSMSPDRFTTCGCIEAYNRRYAHT